MGEQVDGTIEERSLQSFSKACAVPSDLYLDDTSLGEMSSQFSHLDPQFKGLQEWNSVHNRIWTTKIECFKAARVGSIVLVSLALSETFQCLFHSCTLGVRDCSRLVWIAGCSRLRQSIMATRIECETSRVTVMVMYYTWTRIKYYDNHNSSIFICLTMSSDITIVNHLNDQHKTLIWALTASG